METENEFFVNDEILSIKRWRLVAKKSVHLSHLLLGLCEGYELQIDHQPGRNGARGDNKKRAMEGGGGTVFCLCVPLGSTHFSSLTLFISQRVCNSNILDYILPGRAYLCPPPETPSPYSNVSLRRVIAFLGETRY